ncbi:cytochrome P450 [Obba rivulosa]|uniref:Cytochrome P450 n=1 Tax=Obba rivulosa TaxID=1052685 RepID=A0A8E2AW02_9APHY|nr:cytochrome P450 [Obba rivulosa]
MIAAELATSSYIVLLRWALIVGLGTVVCSKVIQLFLRKHVPLPPGPPGHWLLGDSSPKSYVPRYYDKLAETYGPVFTVQHGGTAAVVVARLQAAQEIMTKHSLDLADRPRTIAAGEVMSGNMRILLVGAGERMRKLRKSLHALLQPNVAATYEPIQMKNAKNYIIDILERPEDFLIHAKRYAAAVILEVTYGKTTPTYYTDQEVVDVNACLERLGNALRPGAYLIDTFPILRRVPGYLSTMKNHHQQELKLFSGQMARVRAALGTGEVQPCFATYLLENQAQLGLSDAELAYLAGSMFGAGSDTTGSALGVVSMAAVCHPEAQARVQAQLDKIVGRDRLPTFEDESQLTEVTAFMLESFRWRPVTPMGFWHKATKDIIWKDYVIPAGTHVLGCHWAISRDPEVFPDPEVFNPQRWIDEKGHIRDDLKFPNFGFGRRICPGQPVAERSVYINTALLLWAFNLAQDPSQPIDTYAFRDRAISHPEPFHVMYTPRIEESHLRKILDSH